MTATLVRPSRPERHSTTGHMRLGVPLIAAVAVAMRLPMLGRPPGPDEAGFLMVGHQWAGAGSSLYGDYWVDRPPLLITIFRLAAGLGGVVPLRLLGCVAIVLVVVGSAHVARGIGGDRAANWAALVAAALSISPLLGTAKVDGELLSAPFVVAGLAAALAALHGRSRRRIVAAAAVSGTALVAALMIKQNIADVAVFAAVSGLVAWRRGEISGRHLGHMVLGFTAGAGAFFSVLATWTTAHGTSPTAVFDALYPFRIAAGHVLSASDGSHATIRLWALLGAWVVSGLAVIMIVTAWATASRRLHGTAGWALVATLAFDAASVMLGGNYWHHYLIQLVVPIAILSGVLVARHQPGMTKVLAASAVVAVVAWGIALPAGRTSEGAQIGGAIAAAAHPRDTIVTVYGHAEVSQASGLESPYPYLWSLPVKTLDPRLHDLNVVLGGPRAPTWVVVWSHVKSWGLTSATTSRLLEDHYRPVTRVNGHTVYLHDDVVRPTPHPSGVFA